MKKRRIQNIIIVVVVSLIIGSIGAYSYSTDQTKQKGLQFGKELEKIQNDVKELQTKFYSEKTKWDEGDISKDQLLEFYKVHVEEFEEIILRYENLESPELFKSAVELLKFSSQSQLESDKHYIEWIKTGDEAAKIRSDTQFQTALDYELSGLVEFYSAKTGVKNYEDPEEFAPPEKGLTQKVIQIHGSMVEACNNEFKDENDKFESDQQEIEWFNCINDANSWKDEHMP